MSDDVKVNRENSVNDIPDEELLGRAVRYAKGKRGLPHWSAVGVAFGLSSTYSAQLCRRFGVDPFKPMGRPR